MRATKLPILALFVCAAAYADTITVVITAAIGPALGSPSQASFESNMEQGLQTSSSTFGTPGTPTFYSAITGPISPLGFITTTYNSWLGQQNPPAPFNNETGNAVYFGLSAVDVGGTFDIDDINFFLTGQGTISLAPTPFSAHTVGMNGATTYNTPSNASDPNSTVDDSTQLTSLYTSGLYFDTVVSNPADVQNVIDTELAGLGNLASYTVDLGNVTGGGPFTAQITFDIPDTQVVPEPGSLMLVGFGLTAVYLGRRRFTAR